MMMTKVHNADVTYTDLSEVSHVVDHKVLVTKLFYYSACVHCSSDFSLQLPRADCFLHAK